MYIGVVSERGSTKAHNIMRGIVGVRDLDHIKKKNLLNRDYEGGR